MAETPMTMVYCYDVQAAKTRRAVAKLLEKNAVRVQQSVFEARMVRSAANRLFERAQRLLDTGDSLRMYALGRTSLERSRACGGAPIAEDGNYWIL